MINEKNILDAAQLSAMQKHTDMSYSAAHEAGFIAGARWVKLQMQAENDRLRDVLSAAMENIRNADYAVALVKIEHALKQ